MSRTPSFPQNRPVAVAWTVYCIVGPIHKEARFLRIHGERFSEYRRRYPYLLPIGARS